MTAVLDPPAPEIHADLTRRRFVTGSLGLGAVILTGCGDGDRETAGTTPGSDAFPVTIAHKFGSTQIPRPPKRIVSVGYNDQDFTLALGQPVLGTVRSADYPYPDRPWARQAAGSAKPKEIGSLGELNLEQIAALRPDLIIGLYAGTTKAEYSKLSRIAPTVAQPDRYPDYAIPWRQQLLLTGRALGRNDRARELVEQLENRFAKARREHPELEGRSVVLASLGDGSGYAAFTGPRGNFFTDLGLKIPAPIVKRAGDEYFADFSSEQVRLLDLDVVIMFATRKEAEARPLFRRLDAVREGRVIYLPIGNADLYGALNYNSPLSLPFQIDGFVPRLAAAVDGDPATAIEPIT
ncbi:MAG: iron-siderophore ABC transporter substrate-binding protein [Solirubrobacteraceae bacterium]|nr:iron-siderophore ABC transporter substrate-binding protein [Solirubrobacteraceae bacterium]